MYLYTELYTLVCLYVLKKLSIQVHTYLVTVYTLIMIMVYTLLSKYQYILFHTLMTRWPGFK